MLFASMIVVASAIFMLFMVSGTDYVPLMTNVPSDQTATLMEKLQSKNIPYKIQDGGKTILVPKELVSSTQMSLMSEMGSSKMGQIGMEIFDKQDFGATAFAQHVNYQRAVQGERVTRDLRSFWEKGYFEVRKDLRGRYPKHPWPDEPMKNIPTRLTKKRLGTT